MTNPRIDVRGDREELVLVRRRDPRADVRAFLLRGLGWGGMPHHTVKQDLEEGRLVELSIPNVPPGGASLQMSAIYRASEPPGPAGRWMIERLKYCAQNAE